jgi:carbon monoxide dehydrogenase subunit G
MHLSGRHIVHAKPAEIWLMLTETESLSKIIPGISTLEKTGHHNYKSSLAIKIGPVNDTFLGTIHMENVHPDKAFTLKVHQKGKIGHAKGDIEISLTETSEKHTTVHFSGEIKLSGLMVSIGNRILGSISQTLTKQFFSNLDHEVSKAQNTERQHHKTPSLHKPNSHEHPSTS